MGNNRLEMLVVVAAASALLVYIGCCCCRRRRSDQTSTTPSFVPVDSEDRQMIRTRRRLQESRDVPLFLSLYYLDDETAVQLETRDPSNPLVAHLCQSINTQVCCLWFPAKLVKTCTHTIDDGFSFSHTSPLLLLFNRQVDHKSKKFLATLERPFKPLKRHFRRGWWIILAKLPIPTASTIGRRKTFLERGSSFWKWPSSKLSWWNLPCACPTIKCGGLWKRALAVERVDVCVFAFCCKMNRNLIR